MVTSAGAKVASKVAFDLRLLQYIVCPLSKQPLRFCEQTQHLVSDSIGVAYPVVDGIPLLAPVHGRIMEAGETRIWSETVDTDFVTFALNAPNIQASRLDLVAIVRIDMSVAAI